MISNLTPSSQIFLADIDRIQQTIAEASREVSSGKQVSVASDAPDQVDSILQLRADLQRNSQIKTNLGLAKTEADAGEQALSAGTLLMDRAVTLAAQGANFTQDAAGRQSLAGEVQSLLSQMVSYSRTTVEGRFIFSGDQDQTPAYDLDSTSPTGVVQLNTSSATRQIEDPAGGTFPIAQTAQQIFDSRNPDGTPAPDNVFAALNGLAVALQSNDTDAINAASAAVHNASDHLNTSLAFYGTVQQRIQDASSFADNYDVQLQTELSQKEDADVTSAALALTQSNTQLQAAMQMRAKLPNSSLFDFLG
ncbi:MAG TPA: flagellin [Bryobacteraceae bacterium]|nr:flagellin [Bryobacteraceae bacterium]